MVLFLLVFFEFRLVNEGLFLTLSQFPGVRKSIRVYTPDSLSVVNILDDPAVQGLERMLRVMARLETVPAAGTTVTSTGRRVVSGGVQTAHAIAGESMGNIGLLEVDFYKNRSGHSEAVNAAAGERSGVGLIFHRSRIQLIHVLCCCHLHVHVCLVLLVLLHVLVFASVHHPLRSLLLLHMRMPQPCTMHVTQGELVVCCQCRGPQATVWVVVDRVPRSQRR